MTGPIRPKPDPRIARNVAKIRAAGGTDADVARYLETESASAPAPASPALPGFAPESTRMSGRTLADASARSGDYNLGVQMLRQAGQGAGFGFEDELEAGIRAPFSDRNYTDIRDELRAKEAAFRNDYPVTALASEAAGAIGSGLAMGGASLLKGGAGAARSLGRRVAMSAALGAGQGAASGVGNANGDAGDRVRGGIVGGLVGGTLGGALPLVGAGVTAAARAVRAPAGQRASKVAEEKLLQALERDRLTPQSALERVDELGDAPVSRQVTLLDAGGENTRGLGRAVQTAPGDGRQIVGEFFDARDAGQGKRVAGNFAARTGTKRENLVKLAKQLQDARSAEAEQLYGDAFRKAASEIDDAELNTLLSDYPSFAQSWPKAVQLMREAEGNRAFAARTRGVGEFPGESKASETVKKNARGLYTSAREPSGGFRDPDKVSDEGIIEELKSLYARRDARIVDTNYDTVIDDYGNARQVSRSKTAVTSQGKARTNVKDWDRIINNYEDELQKRGHSLTDIHGKLFGEAGDELEASLERAALEQQNEGTAAGADDWMFDSSAPIPEGPATPTRKPTPKELHYLKMAMDERIEGAASANPLTNTGAGNTSAHLMGQNRDKLVAKLDTHIPGYEKARTRFAQGSEAMQAVDAGQRAWTKAPEAVADEMASLSTDQARDLYRRSLAERIGRELRKVKGGRDVASAVFGTRGKVAGAEDILERARAAFPDETQYKLFLRDLEAEGTLAETSRDVTVGSRTAPALAEQADLAGHPAVTAGRQLATGHPIAAAMTGLFAGAKRRATGFSDDVSRELAKRLIATPGTDPEAFAAMVYALQRSAARRGGAIRGERAVAGLLGNQAAAQRNR